MITSFPVKKDVSAHLKVGNPKSFLWLFTSKLVRWVVSFVQAFVVTSTKPQSVSLFYSGILKAISSINLFTQGLRVANTIAR